MSSLVSRPPAADSEQALAHFAAALTFETGWLDEGFSLMHRSRTVQYRPQ
jgi:hypothetical protein